MEIAFGEGIMSATLTLTALLNLLPEKKSGNVNLNNYKILSIQTILFKSNSTITFEARNRLQSTIQSYLCINSEDKPVIYSDRYSPTVVLLLSFTVTAVFCHHMTFSLPR